MQISFVNTGNPNTMSEAKKVSIEERGFRSNSVYGCVRLVQLAQHRARTVACAVTYAPHRLSLLLGAYAMRYAYDKGCRRAELLAINGNHPRT